MARGEADEDGRVVAAGGNDQEPRALDVDRLQRLVVGRISLQDGAAERLGLFEALLARIDDDNVAFIRAEAEKLPDRAVVLGPEAGDDDVIAKGALDSLHDESFPGSPGDERISRAGQDEQK